MKTTNLISGLFAPDEAKEILLDMLTSKINFHNVKSLSSLVRYNQPNLESESRIKELQESREQLLAVIQKAAEENLHLRIESTVKISFEAQEQPKEVCSKAEDC
jgi:hypothetical protein